MKPIIVFVEDIKNLTKEKLEELLTEAFEQGYTQGYIEGAKEQKAYPITPTSPPTVPPINPFGPIWCSAGLLNTGEDLTKGETKCHITSAEVPKD